MIIRKALPQDEKTLANLAVCLWPHHKAEELAEQFRNLLINENAAFFIAFDRENKAAAFAQCQLRNDYVEGSSGSPVGYLEGIYVAEKYRRRGLAARLLTACEQWSRSQGCSEFASDCELDNSDSLSFHLKNGFTEAGRIICFIKKLP